MLVNSAVLDSDETSEMIASTDALTRKMTYIVAPRLSIPYMAKSTQPTAPPTSAIWWLTADAIPVASRVATNAAMVVDMGAKTQDEQGRNQKKLCGGGGLLASWE